MAIHWPDPSSGDRYGNFHWAGFAFLDAARAVRYREPLPEGLPFHFVRDDAPFLDKQTVLGFNWALFRWFAARSPYYCGTPVVPWTSLSPESCAAFELAFCTPRESTRGDL